MIVLLNIFLILAGLLFLCCLAALAALGMFEVLSAWRNR
jgi:hypothetical protein